MGDCPRVANCVQHLQGILDALYKCAVDPDPTLRLEVLYKADWGGGGGNERGWDPRSLPRRAIPGCGPPPPPQALYTAELVGRFIAPEHYLPLAIPSLHQPQPNPEACRGGGGLVLRGPGHAAATLEQRSGTPNFIPNLPKSVTLVRVQFCQTLRL